MGREGERCGEDQPRLWLAAEVRAFGFGEGIGNGERNKSNEEKRARRMTHEMLEQRRGTMRCSRKEEYIIEDSAADACYNGARKQPGATPSNTNQSHALLQLMWSTPQPQLRNTAAHCCAAAAAPPRHYYCYCC